MNKILDKKQLTENIFWLKISNRDIAKMRKCGQFVIIRVDEYGERIPLSISNATPENGTIEIIIQVMGTTTKKLANLNIGDNILDISGPLGNPTSIKKHGTCIIIGGGVGTAALLSIATALKEKHNKIITILGAKTKDTLILEKEFKNISNELYISTDDGSYGKKGLVTDLLLDLLNKNAIPDQVTAVGPIKMMHEVCKITKKQNILTMVSLNPIMLDGTGMCGGCRCIIDGKQKFACVHGPEFDGHKVDFDILLRRSKMFD